MSRQRIVEDGHRRAGGDEARRRVLAGAPVTERRVELAGVSTAVLESGDGPPVVLLHGQGGWSGMWLPVMGDLMATHRVIAADLPGLGASELPDGPPDAARVLAWLGALIQRQLPGAAGAGRARRSAPPSPPGSPSPTRTGWPGWCWWTRAASAGSGRRRASCSPWCGSLARPSERTQQGFLRQVAVDPAKVEAMMGERWEASQAYNLDRARTPSVRAANRRMLRELGTKAIPPEELARIAVPTTAHLGAPRPGDAAGDRRGGQRPLRLAAPRDRGRRPFRGRAAGGVPAGAAGRAGHPGRAMSRAGAREASVGTRVRQCAGPGRW